MTARCHRGDIRSRVRVQDEPATGFAEHDRVEPLGVGALYILGAAMDPASPQSWLDRTPGDPPAARRARVVFTWTAIRDLPALEVCSAARTFRSAGGPGVGAWCGVGVSSAAIQRVPGIHPERRVRRRRWRRILLWRSHSGIGPSFARAELVRASDERDQQEVRERRALHSFTMNRNASGGSKSSCNRRVSRWFQGAFSGAIGMTGSARPIP